jgi:hypothetical protein
MKDKEKKEGRKKHDRRKKKRLDALLEAGRNEEV